MNRHERRRRAVKRGMRPAYSVEPRGTGAFDWRRMSPGIYTRCVLRSALYVKGNSVRSSLRADRYLPCNFYICGFVETDKT